MTGCLGLTNGLTWYIETQGPANELISWCRWWWMALCSAIIRQSWTFGGFKRCGCQRFWTWWPGVFSWWHGKMMGIKNPCLLVKRNQTHNFWGKNSSWPKSVTSRISAFFQTATVFLGFPEPLRFLFGGGHGIWRSRFQSFPQSFFFWSRKINFNLYEAGWTGWHTRRHKGHLFSCAKVENMSKSIQSNTEKVILHSLALAS